MNKSSLLLCAVPLVCLGTAMCFLHFWGTRDYLAKPTKGEITAIVILGARVNARGQASPILRARAWRAFELWKEGRAPRILCTGGVGDYAPAESVAAEQLLVGWGVPVSAIWKEEKSTSTRENALQAAALLPPRSRVIVVSEPFHLWRASRNFARAGLIPIPAAEMLGWNALRTDQKLFFLFREAILVGRDFVWRPNSSSHAHL